ncbi:uncharacterized protein SPPG_02402 [Spizellomyces punctatus DAOM BR117]|uniref:Partial AB-hydrolase lipase domain-containing protein n=1 Tax=Spizellomyces punctatus (strain DAOM BR117) TaxID=645134 RepID=A0A0L0HR64_SPIPD|nr:uncharacterized protein SPPG_02402 [Spizellomyces punctatus DAOM BR117]KND03359.1 hypothetical protein SPPG_02402 [Spizellomyces punctatus DAOM BR117]|eukprot:XP_016611398.1 hypothetical protein SPPG_02402 [Spizellomyces punctatus DAOM BR117]
MSVIGGRGSINDELINGCDVKAMITGMPERKPSIADSAYGSSEDLLSTSLDYLASDLSAEPENDVIACPGWSSLDEEEGLFDFEAEAVPTEEDAVRQIPLLKDTKELIEFWKYPCEHHIVETRDGFMLGLYRIPNPQHGPTAFSAIPPYERPPVIIWHGLYIQSAAFVSSPAGPTGNLAFVLADAGFDVWLANSRGTVSSRRHRHWQSPEEAMFHSQYWKYVGLDEMAKFDVPAVVNYVCETTGWNKVAYLGYSQGTAQMFMSLSVSEEMNEKVAIFVGLAPALKPKPISNETINALTRRFTPSVLYGLGIWSFLPPAEWLRPMLPSDMYAQIVHNALIILTGWSCDKWKRSWWPALYMHLFGGGSVRNVVHWFRIITEQTFTPYEHEIAPHHLRLISPTQEEQQRTTTAIQTFAPKRTGPCSYPTHHIKTRVDLFCGAEDTISDPDVFKTALPKASIKIIDNYQHMDFLWDPAAKEAVWNDVISAIRETMDLVNV